MCQQRRRLPAYGLQPQGRFHSCCQRQPWRCRHYRLPIHVADNSLIGLSDFQFNAETPAGNARFDQIKKSALLDYRGPGKNLRTRKENWPGNAKGGSPPETHLEVPAAHGYTINQAVTEPHRPVNLFHDLDMSLTLRPLT